MICLRLKLDGQDRLTEVGHSVDDGFFQAFRRFVLSMCYSIDATRGSDMLAINRRRIPYLVCGRWLRSCAATPPQRP